MPYFEQVMDRKFIEKVADVNEDLFDIKEQQYQELIDTHEKLEQKYY